MWACGIARHQQVRVHVQVCSRVPVWAGFQHRPAALTRGCWRSHAAGPRTRPVSHELAGNGVVRGIGVGQRVSVSGPVCQAASAVRFVNGRSSRAAASAVLLSPGVDRVVACVGVVVEVPCVVPCGGVEDQAARDRLRSYLGVGARGENGNCVAHSVRTHNHAGSARGVRTLRQTYTGELPR